MPQALELLAARHRVVLVSGTNGKTTTTLMLSRALGYLGPVISNSDGANLASGVLGTLLLAHARDEGSLAVLELDEVALSAVMEQVDAEVLVLLNLSRDQLDRTAEVSDHVRAWAGAVGGSPGTAVVANADDALVVAAVLAGRPTADGVVWVRAGKQFRQDVSICPRCGGLWDADAEQWCCMDCGLVRPAARWELVDGNTAVVDGELVALELALPGWANASNALMAAAAARLLDVPVRVSLASMGAVQDVEGRYATAWVGGKDLRLLLAKNPAGWLEALDQLRQAHRPVVVAINARDADGKDPSWLWDVPFEQLGDRVVVATGERAADLAVRLTYANIDYQVAEDVPAALELLPAGACDIVANYTAFVAARRLLFEAP